MRSFPEFLSSTRIFIAYPTAVDDSGVGHSLSRIITVTRSLASSLSLVLAHHHCHSLSRTVQKPLAALIRPPLFNSIAGAMHTLRAATRRTYTASADESMWEPGSFSARVLFQLYIRCSMYFDIVVNGRNDRRRPPLERDHAKEEELFAEDEIKKFSEDDILRFTRLPTRWGVLRWDREYLRNQNDQ